MNAKWPKNVIIEEYRKTKNQVVFLFLFFLTGLLWNHFVGQPLEWRWIELISQPTIPYRLLYSALVYLTLGSFLYKIGFYKKLCDFVYGVLGSYPLYVGIKKIIWVSLLALMYFVIVPFVIFLVNFLVSVLYNLLTFLLFLFPGLVIGILVTTGLVFYTKKKSIN